MSLIPPTQPQELASWLDLNQDQATLYEKLTSLISALSDSDDSQRDCTAALSKEEFVGFKSLVHLFAETRDESVVTLVIQLIYACCVLIPGAVSEFFRSGGLQHSRNLLAQSQDSDVVQALLHLVNVCYSPNTTHVVTLPEREIPDFDFLHTLLTITNNFDEEISKIAVTIMLHIHCEFSAQAGNLVLDALRRSPIAQEFGTILIMVLNRANTEEDALLSLRFLCDMFSDPRFKDFLFASNLKVMIDVILREMDGEFEEDKEICYMYLLTLYGALRETAFKESAYRCSDINLSVMALTKYRTKYIY
eukprot:c11991_g1_i2.p1 GENE.c11991_g1_i2~~c11991_g1_i2.p1  ORF type:complete len:313 (+),score=56.07 c11991_g1_i2:24-941(+)